MSRSLDRLASGCRGLDDAIRWACILEATAPKVGNVYPGQSFSDLQYQDFIVAAQATAEVLIPEQNRDRNTAPEQSTSLRLSQRMLKAIQRTRSLTKTNVSLGIVLLLGPLSEADSLTLASLGNVLNSLDQRDGEYLFKMIRTAGAGGMQSVEAMDVNDVTGPVDIVEAMKLASHHDRIALQYATRFQDLFDEVVPVVKKSFDEFEDLLTAIGIAHLRLMAQAPDSLIGRKCGWEVAKEVQQRASAIDPNDPIAVAQFDLYLRSDGNRLNPGTTADLIAASLFVLLRQAMKP